MSLVTPCYIYLHIELNAPFTIDISAQEQITGKIADSTLARNKY